MPLAARYSLTKATSALGGGWRPAREVAEAHEARLRRLILGALGNVRGGVVMRRLAEALAAEDMAAALDAIPWEMLHDPAVAGSLAAALPLAVRDVVERSGVATAAAFARQPAFRASVAFDLLNPRAVDWIRAHSAGLVRDVTDEARAAVRAIMARSFEEGIPPQAAARLIRDVVGLTEREARAVANFRARQFADGVSPQRALRAVERYGARLLNARAERIARTETIRASTEGQQELWRQARDRGVFGAEAVQEWVVTPDDRLCPECEPMDGATAPIGGDFRGGGSGPPLHPNCRCAVVLRPDGGRRR